jgi:hypothetical protein
MDFRFYQANVDCALADDLSEPRFVPRQSVVERQRGTWPEISPPAVHNKQPRIAGRRKQA